MRSLNYNLVIHSFRVGRSRSNRQASQGQVLGKMASLKNALKLEQVARRLKSVSFTYKTSISRKFCGARCQLGTASDNKYKRSRNELQTNRRFSTKQEVSQNIVETLSKPALHYCEENSRTIHTNNGEEVIEVPKDLTEADFIEVMSAAKIEKYAKTVSCPCI